MAIKTQPTALLAFPGKVRSFTDKTRVAFVTLVRKENIVPEMHFPRIPYNIDNEMREYLSELERVLLESLKGSLWLSRTFEDGLLGN